MSEWGQTGVRRGEERGERDTGHAVLALPGVRSGKLERGQTGVTGGRTGVGDTVGMHY